MTPSLKKTLVSLKTGKLTAVQDTTGKLWCRLREPDHNPGTIVAKDFENSCNDPLREEGTSPIRFCIIQRVHANTVNAFLRRIGQTDKKLSLDGYWYEVHAD